jgi:hypothetical protein
MVLAVMSRWGSAINLPSTRHRLSIPASRRE